MPFRLQIYFNQHQWLARALQRRGIHYQMVDNAFVEIDDWKLADDETSLFELILALHDDQLARAPMHRVVDAEKRLRAFVMGSAPSPLADLK